MVAIQLINNIIPPLQLTDHSYKAIKWMEEFRIDQLPVVDDDHNFLGIITEDMIWDENNIDMQIKDFELIAQRCYVNPNQHLYDVLQIANEQQVHLIAVLDQQQKYQGVITLDQTIIALSQSIAIQSPGGILTISLRMVDYSMAEISRIVEAESVKILSSWVNVDEKDANLVNLTLKFDTTNLSRVIASLERFEYKITAKYHEPPNESKDIQNLDILMKFINM